MTRGDALRSITDNVSMEKMIGFWVEYNMPCDQCVLSDICENSQKECSDVWENYLGGGKE